MAQTLELVRRLRQIDSSNVSQLGFIDIFSQIDWSITLPTFPSADTVSDGHSQSGLSTVLLSFAIFEIQNLLGF
jgi:hypothetical protein